MTEPNQPILPPDLDGVLRLLRPQIAKIPEMMAQWAVHEGPLAAIPLLDPGSLAPKVFEEVSGTIRVAGTDGNLVTIAGLLQLPTGPILATAMVVSPADLAMPPQREQSRQALAAAGAASASVMVEAAALISPLEQDGTGPVAAVGIVRPLAFADPANFPHTDDGAAYPDSVVEAAAQAVADETEMVSDLGGSTFMPLEADMARIWGPMFAVARAATVGLAARGAGISSRD